MKRTWLLGLLALAGVAIAVVVVLSDRKVAPSPRADVVMPVAPFASYITGSGIVEAATGNIAIGTPIAGIVADVLVTWGEPVVVDQPLFRLDARDLEAELPGALARVREAESLVQLTTHELRVAERLRAAGVSSEEDLKKRRYSADAQAAALAVTVAEVERLRANIERRTVRSPSTGRVLRLDVRPGEFADNANRSAPLMVVGDDSRFTVRVDVDEHDASRVRAGARAEAFVRGSPEITTPLIFERIEPFAVPKTSLSGGSSERTDTRVLQVIYSFQGSALPVYAGQQLDVFIEARPSGAQPSGAPAPAPGAAG